jgi:hypothetical protein
MSAKLEFEKRFSGSVKKPAHFQAGFRHSQARAEARQFPVCSKTGFLPTPIDANFRMI